jgi:hypothetical protein
MNQRQAIWSAKMMQASTVKSKINVDKKGSAILRTTAWSEEIDRTDFAKLLKSSGNLCYCGFERNLGDK